MNNRQTKHFFLFVVILMVFGITLPVLAKEKKKQIVAVKTPQADILSYNDRQRYSYFFLEAVKQQNSGNYAAAFDLLSRCLQINPNAAETYYMLARYLSQLKQDSTALAYLEKAASLRPDNDTYQEQVAQFYIGVGDYVKATDAYERLYSTNRDRTDVLNILLKLYKQQNNHAMMLNTIARIEQLEGESEQLSLSKMNVYEMMGDSKNAYQTLKELAASHPNDLNYRIMLGNWLMQNKRQKEACKLFEQALKEEPDNTYAQSSMYDYYRSTGQTEQAQQMMEQILLGKNTPSDSRLQFLRQAVQENEQQGGDSMNIINLIHRMQEVVPKDAQLAEMKAAYYTLKQMPEEEVNRALVELLELAPDNAGARFQLIQNKWSKENWEEVAELSEPGMLYNPEEMAFYYFTGLARYYQKDDDRALDAFQRGTAEINSKSDPSIVSDFYAIMGEIYHRKGDSEKAYAAYDSCLQWKPDQVMTLNNYAYYLSVDGKDLKRAEEMSAKTIKAEPKNATFLDTYAWVLYKQGRYAEAKIYIDQALQNDTDSVVSAEVLEHAGDINLKVGNRPEAVKYWQQALAAGGGKDALEQKIKQYIKEK